MNNNITAVVFTKNEERRLPYIYENFKKFCKIIVFDGGSVDGTKDFCDRHGIQFVRRPDIDPKGGLKWVLENVVTDYVIHVYCAHFFPYPLLKLFSRVASEGIRVAVFHDVVIYRYGSVVHRPNFRRVSAGCNFYKKTTIDFENNKFIVHDELGIRFNAETMIRLPAVDEMSLHLFQDDDCESYIKKTINYAVTDARQRFNAGEEVTLFGIVFGPFARFIFAYFRMGSFSKGPKGLVYALLNMMYDFTVKIILWELANEVTYHSALKKNSDTKAILFREKGPGSGSGGD
jgi:glycosyltransferase involved in cell wall biosynthesis